MRGLTRSQAFPYFMLAVSLVLSAVPWYLVRRQMESRVSDVFEDHAAEIHFAIDSRMRTYVRAILVTRGMIEVMKGAGRREFAEFIRTIDLERVFPGMQGIGYAPRVPRAELAGFTGRVRAEGFREFRVWPEGDRLEYFPVLYLEPFDARNRRAFGFDLLSEPVRRAAMEQAALSGEPAMSRKVVLVQDEPAPQPGFLVFVPVYWPKASVSSAAERRRSLRGFVYSPFQAQATFEEVLAEHSEILGGLRVQIFDGKEADSKTLVFENRPGPPGGGELSSWLHKDAVLSIADRHWLVRISSAREWNPLIGPPVALILLILGASVSLLLFRVLRAEWVLAQRIEKERAQFEAVFEVIPASVVVRRGRHQSVTFGNRKYRESFAGASEVFPVGPDGSERLDAKTVLDQVFATGKAFSGTEQEFRIRDARTGETKPCFLSYVVEPLRDPRGRVEGVISFVLDVSEQVHSRRRIEELVRELQAAVQSRDVFLSIASHELKTPLTPLKLQVQTLLRTLEQGGIGRGELLEPSLLARFQRMLRLTDRQVDRLARIVDEMLDLSRINVGRLTLAPEDMDLVALVREILARFEQQFSEAGIPFSFESSESELLGRWDSGRMDQVITNLLTNALKYGARRPIEIRVGRLPGDQVELQVRDHGIGISPEDQARVFERFERAVSEQHFGGLGLGLAIAREIVRAHGGEIELQSELGKGSTFTVRLPRLCARS